MAKPPPNVLDDLLFHTRSDAVKAVGRSSVQDAAGTADRVGTDWSRPDWKGDAAATGLRVPIHPERLADLRAWAAAAGLPLRDVVDRALALLLARPAP
jgi:hypothetical protein